MLRFVLFALLSIASMATKKEEKMLLPPIRPWPPYYGNNATGVFNPYTEKCCLGKILPHKNNIEKCCGNDAYNPTREICCDTVKYPFTLGTACCGNTTYNSDEQMCCNNVVADIKSKDASPYLQCCGNKSYDMREEACCYTNNYAEMVVVPSKSGNNPQQNMYGTCCNGQLINSSSQGCCNNQLYDVSNKGCCNDTVYDLDEKTCCYNEIPYTLIPITKRGQTCCYGKSKKLYDPATQFCCGDTVQNTSRQSSMSCCGDNVYDYNTEICCYSGNTSKAVKKENRNQHTCCDGKALDSSAESCCYGEGAGNEKPYKYSTETCCGGKVYSEKGICCYGLNGQTFHKVENNSSNYQCCGDKPYNYMTQVCCGSTVKNKSTSMQYCCGEDVYDVQKQICCSSYDYSNGNTTSKVFDQKTGMSCCGLQLINYNDGEQCCGNKVFNANSQVCCGNDVFPKGKDDDSTCCFQYTTDSNQCTQYPIYPILK